jgi:hypothetical protein
MKAHTVYIRLAKALQKYMKPTVPKPNGHHDKPTSLEEKLKFCEMYESYSAKVKL